MTFAMYEALFERCEEADADDVGARARAARRGREGVRGRHRHPPVRGVRVRRGRARATRRRSTASSGGSRPWRKPTVALVDGYAMGSGLALAAACDLRVCTPAASSGCRSRARVGNCLSMENYARLAALLGPARLKDLVFTARSIGAEEALAIGLATEVVEPAAIEAHVDGALRAARVPRRGHAARHEGGAAPAARRRPARRRRPRPRGVRQRGVPPHGGGVGPAALVATAIA